LTGLVGVSTAAEGVASSPELKLLLEGRISKGLLKGCCCLISLKAMIAKQGLRIVSQAAANTSTVRTIVVFLLTTACWDSKGEEGKGRKAFRGEHSPVSAGII
jgi:hypothetical protein